MCTKLKSPAGKRSENNSIIEIIHSLIAINFEMSEES